MVVGAFNDMRVELRFELRCSRGFDRWSNGDVITASCLTNRTVSRNEGAESVDYLGHVKTKDETSWFSASLMFGQREW